MNRGLLLMALAVAQILASSRSSATSLTRTYAGAVGSGSLLVAHGAVYNAGGSGEPTVSDTVNGSWTGYSTTGYFTSGDADSEIYLWSFPNSGAGTPGVTMNPPGTSSDNDLTLFEVTGAATSTPRDVSVTNTGTFGAATTSAPATNTSVTSGTLAQTAEIVIFSFSHTAASTALGTDTGDGFTQADENESNATGQAFNVGYKITSATTSLVCNGSLAQIGTGEAGSTNTWFSGVASFKEAAAGGATVKPRSLLSMGCGC